MAFHQTILSFNGGEVTPYLAHATNFTKHASSAARMENFLPMPWGAIRKRPGTLHLATFSTGTRLEAFTFTDGSSWVFAFQADRIRILDTEGNQVASLAAAFTSVMRLQFAQVNDMIFMVAYDIPPARIYRDGSTWIHAELEYDYPPLLPANKRGRFLTIGTGVEDNAAPGATLHLEMSVSFFRPGHVGAYMEISKKRGADDFARSLDATDEETSEPIEASTGAWFLTTFGTWTGEWTVQRSDDNGDSWKSIRKFAGKDDRNVAAEGQLDAPCLIRLKFDGSTESGPRGELSVDSPFVTGIVRITAVGDVNNATCEAVTRVPKGITTRYWAEGAFSARQGYPKTLAVHDRRLVFAGTDLEPMSLWISATDDLLNFRTGTEADDGIQVTLAATRQSPIRWITSQRRLFVGTDLGEWVFGSDRSDAALSPANVMAREYTRFGTGRLPAIPINDSIFFIERNGLRLRELAFVLERETYDAANLTRLAEHITEGGITQMAWQQSREPFLWCVTAPGSILAFAYHRGEDIAAWSRHTTEGGLFRSVAVIRNNAGDDHVFLIVQRGTAYCLEKFAGGQQAAQEAGTLDAVHHVDAGVQSATSGSGNDVNVPAHLNGRTLTVMADGHHLTLTATGGKISLPTPAASVHAGLPLTATFTSLPQDMQVENGTSHGRRKRASEILLNVYQTRGGSVSHDGQERGIHYTGSTDVMDSPPALATGWFPQTLSPAHVDDLTFSIIHREPWPIIVRAAVLRWQIHEP